MCSVNVVHRNHPVIKEDGVLAVFLTEPSFENWRKHNAISYEEESASKRVDRVEEMAIPSDLENKLRFASKFISRAIFCNTDHITALYVAR